MQVCLSIYDVLKPTVLKKLRKHTFSYGEQFSEAGISGKFLGLFLNFDDIYTRQICFKLKRSLKIFSKMELCHNIFGQNVNKIAFTCACIQKTNEEVFIMWLKSINNYFFCYCFLLFYITFAEMFRKVDANKRKNELFFFFFFETLKN